MSRMTEDEIAEYEARIDAATPRIQQISQILHHHIGGMPSQSLSTETVGPTRDGTITQSGRTDLPISTTNTAKPDPPLKDLVRDKDFPAPPRQREEPDDLHRQASGPPQPVPRIVVRAEDKQHLTHVKDGFNALGSTQGLLDTSADYAATPAALTEMVASARSRDPFATPALDEGTDGGGTASADEERDSSLRGYFD